MMGLYMADEAQILGGELAEMLISVNWRFCFYRIGLLAGFSFTLRNGSCLFSSCPL